MSNALLPVLNFLACSLVAAALVGSLTRSRRDLLIPDGLLTSEQLDLICHGTRTCGVVTEMRVTGATHDHYREVELDLMVKKRDGGQFPAHETALIPRSSLEKVSPGSIVDAFYQPGDESVVAVRVPTG